ncbi:MAG: hypothetical protein ACC628_09930, partial [Pirellulaceae bacterium]
MPEKAGCCVVLILRVFVCAIPAVAEEKSDQDLMALGSAFETRRDAVLASQVASPYPPLSGDGKAYSGINIWHRLDFALAALFLDESIEEANRSVMEAAHMSLAEIQRGEPDRDFHWHAPLYVRIYSFFHAASQHFPGRLSSQAEEAIREVLWEWARTNAALQDTNPERVWVIWGSENHDAMRDGS